MDNLSNRPINKPNINPMTLALIEQCENELEAHSMWEILSQEEKETFSRWIHNEVEGLWQFFEHPCTGTYRFIARNNLWSKTLKEVVILCILTKEYE